LYDSTHFFRSHQVPALSTAKQAYRSIEFYLGGGVWAPVNFMIVQGLSANGAHKQETCIVKNHRDTIEGVSKFGIQNKMIILF
jgi:neutral trehalase